MNRLEYPARVGHAVTHSSTAGTLTLAAGGILVGIVIVVTTAPETVTVAVVTTVATTATEAVSGLATAGAAISTVATYGKAGLAIGKILDTFVAPSVAGHLVHGYPDVLLGPSVRPAARAEPTDTQADCHGDGKGFEGSSTVFLGREHKPMSRREDRLHCAGVISEGEPSIIVGGAPSQEGVSIAEADNRAVQIVSFGLDAMSVANPAFGTERSAWRAALGSAQVLAESTGHQQVADVLGMPTTRPSSLADAYNAFNSANSGVTAGAGLVSPPPAAGH